MRNFKWLLLALLLLASPILAQEPTQEVLQTPETNVDQTDVLNIIIAVLGAFAAGNITMGMVSVALLRNKPALDAMERVATNTIPASVLPVINDLAKNAVQLGNLIETITDNEPNVPVETPAQSQVRMVHRATQDPPPNPTAPRSLAEAMTRAANGEPVQVSQGPSVQLNVAREQFRQSRQRRPALAPVTERPVASPQPSTEESYTDRNSDRERDPATSDHVD